MENLFNNYYLNGEDPIDEVRLKEKDPYKKFSKLRDKRTEALNAINKFYADNNANRVLRTIPDKERLQKKSAWQSDIKEYRQMLKDLKQTEKIGKTYYDAIGKPSNLTPYQLLTTPEGYGAIKRARDKGVLDDRSFMNYMDNYGREYDPMGYRMTPEESRKYEDVRMKDVDAFASKVNKLAMAAPLLGGAGALSTGAITNLNPLIQATGAGLRAPLLNTPGLTAGNLINLGFGLHGASNISEDIKKGNYGEAAFDALEVLGSPGMGKAIGAASNLGINTIKNLPNQYNKIATGNSRLTDFGVPAWKVEQNAINPKSSQYITRNYTDAEAKVLSKYGEGMNLTPEEWKVMEGITKSGATKFSGDYPITRVIDYYNKYTPENEAIKKLKIGNTFKTPEEKAIRTWTAGARPAEEYLEGSTRLVIPSRYTKNLGSNFAGMPYYDKRVGFIWGDRGLNTNAVLEKELMGNIPEGFKVIGKSKDGGFNNLIIRPTNYSSASNANLNTGTESINNIFNNKYIRGFKDLTRVGDQALGELIQGKANRRAIERGNKWLGEWINHPVTQQKIIESEPYIARAKDSLFLKHFNLGKDQARTFKPGSKEYSFKNQLKDLIDKRRHIHKGNWGVSYAHNLFPAEAQRIQYKKLDKVDPRMGSWISRNPFIKQRDRESITIHEGTHDWLTNFMLDNTKQKKLIESLMSGNAYDKYRTWANLRNQGIDPANKMGKTEAYLGYLADPTEVHARIMELRRALELTPKDFISEKKAESIIKNLNEGKIDTKVDPRFLKSFDDNPRSVATLFNTLWYADPKNADPVLQQQINDPLFKAKGGSLNKPKNIPMYYDFSGTPIYRNTTSLPFGYGGRMKNYYDVGGPVDGISEETSKQLLNAPIIGKVNYVPKSRNFTPGFVQGPTLDAYNKASEERRKSASNLKTAKTKLEEEEGRIAEGTKKMMEAMERATYDNQYNKIFKYKLPDGSFYCNTRNCELARIAGRLTVEDMKLFEKEIPAGSIMPIVPGIGSQASILSAAGYAPVSREKLQPGDIFYERSSANDPLHLALHTGRYAGDDTWYEDHGAGLFYDKTKNRPLRNPLFYRYVGNTPALQTKVGEAEEELSKASEQFRRTELPAMSTIPISGLTPTTQQFGKTYNLDLAGRKQLLQDQTKHIQDLASVFNTQRMFRSGGYTVTRSNDRKGKTHKVVRNSDGKTEYYGHPMKNQPKNPKTKKAAEARHRAQGNFQNPFFKAYWDATWRYGGNMYLQGGNMDFLGDPPPFKDLLSEGQSSLETENFKDNEGYNLNLIYPTNNLRRFPKRFGYDDYYEGAIEITKDDPRYKAIKKEIKSSDQYKKELENQRMLRRFPRESYFQGKKSYTPSQEFLDRVAFQAANKGEPKMGDTDELVRIINKDLGLENFNPGANTGTVKQRKLAQRLEHSPAWYAANALKERDALGVSMPDFRYGGNIYGHGGHMYDLFTHGTYGKGGQLIKRADGSYSQRGLWDNIRANKGSGKKPTKEMLKQERKIKKSQS